MSGLLESTEPQEPAVEERRPQADQTWLVQAELPEKDYEGATPRTCWVDLGTVTVPARSRRRTIIEKALASPWAKDAAPAQEEARGFRVLDADSAAAIPVRWEVPPAPEPVLRIGAS